jgi:LuxR family maltose regulon positive regulatory protein
MAKGMSNKQIAHRLDIAPETVKSHAKSIFVKLVAQTRAQAVAHAETLSLI